MATTPDRPNSPPDGENDTDGDPIGAGARIRLRQDPFAPSASFMEMGMLSSSWFFPPQSQDESQPDSHARSLFLTAESNANNALWHSNQNHLGLMTDSVFPLDEWLEEWLTEARTPPPDGQPLDESPQNAPVPHVTIDPDLLVSPLEALFSALDIQSNASQRGSSCLMTPSSSPSFPLSFPAGLASEGTSPRSPLRLRPSSCDPPVESSYESLLEQGYPGDSPLALERREILRRTIFNETTGFPTSARDIKKLAEIQRTTEDIPDDALPSSGKKSGSFVLHCAWAGCAHYSSRPDRLKTHVFTHIGFKPFPCDRSCGDSHCTARFNSKGDCNSHQTRHEKKIICEYCGEESTAKNLTRHTRSTKCKNNARRNTSYSL